MGRKIEYPLGYANSGDNLFRDTAGRAIMDHTRKKN